MKRHVFLTAIVVSASAASLGLSQAATQTGPVAAVDAVFGRWNASTPGCAVGVAVKGKPVLERAYGMADLERDVENAPDTIFEAGSVSKQFTAAAVLLLARDGKLSIDDPVRKYVPELPDYGVPLTIRHMLTHTSGLRDWGSIASIGGWPRTQRAHTHAHVLDIVSRQKALNFTPGTNWSYSNTGYNLSAVIVARVSGQSFADFSRDRIFKPLGMTRTSWRDDFKRIVKHRAIAYEPAAEGYRENMPFENVHGNGGLLTTVGDLLRWNENFVKPVVGDAGFVAQQQATAKLSDGRDQPYAFGLYVRPYRGVPEVSHSGTTAGYQAFLTRFPDQHVSVAVLCNTASATPTQYARAVAEMYLGGALGASSTATTTAEGGGRGGRGRGASAADAFKPDAVDVAAYAGRYSSDEAETEFTIALDAGELVLKQRPDVVRRMRAVEKDVFAVPVIGTVTFRRDAGGRVTALSVRQDRVWDLRFARLP
jgi:CubicO group peptidase (beta-lactamase class C family)